MKKPTAKEVLRAIIKEAKERKTYYVILDEKYIPYWKEWHHRIAVEMGCDDTTWMEVYRLNKRYKRFCHYVEEIIPQWRDIDKIYFADNSVETIQINRWGETRKVMIVPPHGDVC